MIKTGRDVHFICTLSHQKHHGSHVGQGWPPEEARQNVQEPARLIDNPGGGNMRTFSPTENMRSSSPTRHFSGIVKVVVQTVICVEGVQVLR